MVMEMDGTAGNRTRVLSHFRLKIYVCSSITFRPPEHEHLWRLRSSINVLGLHPARTRIQLKPILWLRSTPYGRGSGQRESRLDEDGHGRVEGSPEGSLFRVRERLWGAVCVDK